MDGLFICAPPPINFFNNHFALFKVELCNDPQFPDADTIEPLPFPGELSDVDVDALAAEFTDGKSYLIGDEAFCQPIAREEFE